MKDILSVDLTRFDIVSFDVYDTLIKRDVFKPSRVFLYIERIVGDDFFSKRREAELKARESTEKEEISLKEIYSLIPGDNNWKEKAYLLELEYEQDICRPNDEIVCFLEKCRELGKRILIISDMYLPKETISHILETNKIYYDSLYVSYDIGCTKRTGSLYQYVKNEEKIEFSKWLHVGDNKKSDFLSARKLGISAFLIESNYNKNVWFTNDVNSDDKDITAFISNRISCKDYFYHVGYESLGPLLYGFSKWLNTQVENDNLTKLFFLSRDGQLMEAAYNLCGYNNVDHCYMYASRRSLIVPSLFLSPELDDVIKNIFWPRIGSVGSFMKKVGLNPGNYTELIAQHKLDVNKIYDYSELFKSEDFKSFYEIIKADVISNSKCEYELLIKYLKSIGFEGKIGVIDIGWHGNMQKALSRITSYSNINADIVGYYIGINPEVNHTDSMKGYVFDQNRNENDFLKERLFTCIFEMLFSANHGSVIRFIASEEIVEKEEFEYDKYPNDYESIKKIQNGALDFVKDIINDSVLDYRISEQYGFNKLMKIGITPSKEDAFNFGSMIALRDEVTKIAEPKKFSYYFAHPKAFRKDLNNSSWRIGFLKRLTGLSLPYYELYYALKRIKK